MADREVVLESRIEEGLLRLHKLWHKSLEREQEAKNRIEDERRERLLIGEEFIKLTTAILHEPQVLGT